MLLEVTDILRMKTNKMPKMLGKGRKVCFYFYETKIVKSSSRVKESPQAKYDNRAFKNLSSSLPTKTIILVFIISLLFLFYNNIISRLYVCVSEIISGRIFGSEQRKSRRQKDGEDGLNKTKLSNEGSSCSAEFGPKSRWSFLSN